MKKLITWIANLTRVVGGLFAFLIMLVGASTALKKFRVWLRRKKDEKEED